MKIKRCTKFLLMQSCSKRNELPLNAKLWVQFLFLIHAEYSKVSSFFFSALILTCAKMSCAEMSCAEMSCAEMFCAKMSCAEMSCAEMSWTEFVAPKCPGPNVMPSTVNQTTTLQSLAQRSKKLS